MKVIPIARYLADFAQDAAAPQALAPAAARNQEAELQDAFRRGRETGSEAARVAYEAQLAEEKAKSDAHIAALRAAWVAEESAKLAADLGRGLERIEVDIAAAAARLLEPILGAEARRAMLDDLAAALAQIRLQRPAIVFTITGPADLLDALRARLPQEIAAQYQPDAASEIRVETGLTIIETCLAAWHARLAEHAR